MRHLNPLDYAVVAAYLVLVSGVGVYMARFNRKTGDYFKGGGHIPWLLSAVSLFVSGYSAFMFVGAAGFTYRNGGPAILLFTSAFWAYWLGFFVVGRRWRRSRIDTPMEFLSRRFSPSTTYFYTLLTVLPSVLMLGTALYTLCIFVSAALGFSGLTFDLGFATLSGFHLTLLVTGAVMMFYTVVGGLWAVMVTDALQFLILFLVTLLVLPMAYIHLGDGNLAAGVARLGREAPEGYFGLRMQDHTPGFYVAYFINIILGYNVNWYIAQRYYSVPDERDTRKMAVVAAVFSVVGPLLWILPVLATRVLFPDLDAMWPELAAPSEAAFVTLAMTVLPHGMLGVMVAAIFAAATSSADTTFNWLAAVITKDVYLPLSRRLSDGREPSERRQLWVGRGTILAIGAAALWVAWDMGRYGGAFDVYLKINSLYSAAMFVPVLLGLLYTRTPWWSGMASFGTGLVAVILVGFLANRAAGLPAGSLMDLALDVRVAPLGFSMGRYEINMIVGTGVAALCFFLSGFVPRGTGAFAARILRLEEDLRTPAHAEGGALDLRGLEVYRLIGWIAVFLGGFLALLTLLTASAPGAWLNLAAGLLSAGLGLALIRWAGRYRAVEGSRFKVQRSSVSNLEP